MTRTDQPVSAGELATTGHQRSVVPVRGIHRYWLPVMVIVFAALACVATYRPAEAQTTEGVAQTALLTAILQELVLIREELQDGGAGPVDPWQ